MPDIKLRRIQINKAGASLLTMLSLACLLSACGPDYSPDTYSSAAVQQASKVDAGVVVGVRKVDISADATLGAATGAAAGGITGSQAATGAAGALGAVGGAVAGGIAGNGLGHSVSDTFGYEYIVRKANGDLLSVTQKDQEPLKIGMHVLIIQGPQARIVSDYTVPVEAETAVPKPAPAKTASAPPPPAAQTSEAPQSEATVPGTDAATATHGPGAAH
jgi:outer membrane lipoprotein SlyB